MFKFDDGARVTLKNSNPHLALNAGSIGKVWARYDTDPVSYEVTFTGADGIEFDALVLESELAAAADMKREISTRFAEAS